MFSEVTEAIHLITFSASTLTSLGAGEHLEPTEILPLTIPTMRAADPNLVSISSRLPGTCPANEMKDFLSKYFYPFVEIWSAGLLYWKCDVLIEETGLLGLPL